MQLKNSMKPLNTFRAKIILQSVMQGKRKLGKKKIKNGAKVTKAGTYTLKVTDKAGNKTTVKFTIK